MNQYSWSRTLEFISEHGFLRKQSKWLFLLMVVPLTLENLNFDAYSWSYTYEPEPRLNGLLI